MPRTFLFSLVIAGFVALLSKSLLRKRLLFWTSTILISIAILLWFSKLDSSLGRIHIWKLSQRMLANQTFWQGIGHNQFNVHYNHLQASYFKERGLSSKEALLANDGYYAFNESMHWGIEWAWWAGALLLFLFALFLYQNWRLVKNRGRFNVEFLCTMLLWPIAVGCWVGYPLHKPYLAIYTLSVSLMLMVSIIQPKPALRYGFFVIKGLMAVSGMVLHGWEQRNAKMVIEEARELWMIGDKPAAIEQLRNYCIKQPDAIPHNEILAKWLWLVGQEREAINWMIGHHQYHCNQRMHETLGQWYAGAGNYEQSSIHLHTSLYITPHLLRSRALLADYYYLIRNLDSARYWAKEVLYTPPKIENAKASELKRAAANWLLPDHPEGLPFQLLN